ncbi:hypothetical protein CRV01_01065 [Arcobacter sp. CECT 8983]|uniref:two-partner secretion domain-containing protein n=1 Tax=Arcobacter sp. CECT 8983 TaxID=2044508 RepID=UPI00100B8345|nr:filamentous hemagglutinin N-terminal domain-containing protein [Arcobacter sp. CECT 8983]RXJ91710.1 hypothetical protein CRV01_01065 [Arcobacter sp. CECT 8983]
MKRLIDFSSRFRILKGGKISLVVSALLGTTTLTFAAPSGGVVTSGNANISQSGNTTNIVQNTNKVSINWNKFNIATDEVVNFKQPNVNSIALNRVVGNEKSIINGALNANGQVWILNSNGVLFGKNAKINTSGLLATTKNLSDQDFNAANYNFKGSSTEAIINLGEIDISDSGYATLLANTVSNEGTIKAVKGSVRLVGADDVTINLNGNSIVDLTVNKGVLDSLVENKGAIYADGGEIYLTTNAVNELLKGVVNNEGIIEANSFEGVTGYVELFAHGGEAKIGGTITAKEGFVETSGKEFTFNDAKIEAGKWLIDPVNITIDTALASAIVSALDTGDVTIETDQSDYSDIDTSSSGTNSESGSNGNIFVNANIITNNLGSADRTFTLLADNNITFADGINIDATQNANTNKLNVILTADNNNSGSGQIIVSGSTGNSILTNNGNVTINNKIDGNVDGETPLVINAGTGDINLNDDLGESKRLKSLTVTANNLNLGSKLHKIITKDEQVYNAIINSLATAQFANSGFEDGNTSNWTIDTTNTIYLNGGSVIAGYNTPNDDILPNTVPTKDSESGAYDDYDSTGNYSATLSGDTDTDGGSNSLQLTYSSGQVTEGYGVVHGPSVVSDNSVSLEEGDGVSFKWKAQGGSDAYDVFGYILNVDTGETQVILNETGATGSATTNWASASVTANKAGNYKFIFVAGSWDASGGRALGANLYIDNITTYSNKSFIGSNVTFNNTLNGGSSEIQIKADKINFNSTISGKNTLKINKRTAGGTIELGGNVNNDSNILDFTSSDLANIQDFTNVIFGDSNTGKVVTTGDITTNYDIELHAANEIEIANTLDAGTNTLTLNSTGTTTDSGNGYIQAKNLNLKGSGNFNLDNDNNDVDILAAGTKESPIGQLYYKDKDDVKIGKVDDSKGLNAKNNIEVNTLSGDITVEKDVITEKRTDDAIKLNAEAGNVNKNYNVYVGPKIIETTQESETKTDNKSKEIEKIVTTITNKEAIKTPLPPKVTTTPTNLTKIAVDTEGNKQIISKPIEGQATKRVSMSEAKKMQEDATGEKVDEVKVPLSRSSQIVIVGNGILLPEGVEQEFYVAEDEI